MADYKVVYTMIDGSTVVQHCINRGENLQQMTEVLVVGNYAIHATPDGKIANIINNRNVLRMEVSEL